MMSRDAWIQSLVYLLKKLNMKKDATMVYSCQNISYTSLMNTITACDWFIRVIDYFIRVLHPYIMYIPPLDPPYTYHIINV